MDTLRISTSKEAPLEASKWLQCQALLSPEEMEHLFTSLEPFALFFAGSITAYGQAELPKFRFLELYKAYIADLRTGKEPYLADYRSYFSAVMTASNDALYKILTGTDRQLVRIAKPVIQMQAHNIDYSPFDGKFRSMVFGNGSISWGIQFSFPQLFQDTASKEVLQTRQQIHNVNTQLFQRLQKWMRTHTIPSPFCVQDSVIHVPVRLGKECFGWINSHPQLSAKALKLDFKI
jgi:hypothetical protein